MRTNERMRRAWAELGVVVLGVFGVIADLILDVGLHKGEDAELYQKKDLELSGSKQIPNSAKRQGTGCSSTSNRANSRLLMLQSPKRRGR